MIEFDVLPEDMDDRGAAACCSRTTTSTTCLGDDARRRARAPRLVVASNVDLDVDLKLPGYEARVVEALRAHGLIERALVSSTFMRSLVALRALEPRLRLGWSVPRARRDYTAVAAVDAARLRDGDPHPAAAARIARRHLDAGRCDAMMAHWRLVSPALVQAVAGAGGELYVWTVDDAARIQALEAMGVTGVITNDPRLF